MSMTKSREWICNIVHIPLYNQFTDFIIEKQRLREKKVIKNKDLGIETKFEFVKIKKIELYLSLN